MGLRLVLDAIRRSGEPDGGNGGLVAPSVFGGGVELGYPVGRYGTPSRSALDFDPYLGFAAQHGYWTDHLTGLILCTYR